MTFADRFRYERTFSLRERYVRSKEKFAMFIAWHLLPARVRMWVVIRAHAAKTTGNIHLGDVTAFDLYRGA